MLKSLDENFELLDDLTECIMLIWERRYYECGEFTLTIPTYKFDNKMRYLYSDKHIETGIINAIDVKDDITTISGFFLEKILDDKIIFPVFNFSGNIEQCARDMILKYKEDIPKLKLGNLLNLGSDVSVQETGEELGKRIYTLYKTQELGYRLNYDYFDDIIYFESYEGVQRQASFSKRLNNIMESSLISDDSNFKNFAVVAGEGEGTKRKFVNVDLSNGGYKQKIFVDARDIQKDDKQTIASYEEELKQRGIERLLEYTKIQEFNFKLTENEATRYQIDFDLGDKIEVSLPEIGIDILARITEIKEVMKENIREITITIGEQKPTIYQKIGRK